MADAGRETGAPARLALLRVTLTAFRNYARLRLDLDGRPVALFGPNGAGKTNLLEAISLLGAGRGLRGARLAEIDHRPAAEAEAPRPWAVAARLTGPEGAFDVGTGRDLDSSVSRRMVRIDGRPESGPAALAARVPLLWLTPAQDRLFLDLPGARRRFLDGLVAVLDPAHVQRLAAYERALRERARLLRGDASGPSRNGAGRSSGVDPAWLAALERGMAENGVAIAAARRQVARDLSQAAALGVGPFPAALLGVEGDVESWLEEGPALDAEDRLACELDRSRGRDAETGGAACGPHRSDLRVVHAGRRLAAAEMSTGEQKTLLLSIILAAARLQAKAQGFAPLLLLDEVAAHLDSRHREGLYEEIAALGIQAFMTGTDPVLFAPLGAHAARIEVQSGLCRVLAESE